MCLPFQMHCHLCGCEVVLLAASYDITLQEPAQPDQTASMLPIPVHQKAQTGLEHVRALPDALSPLWLWSCAPCCLIRYRAAGACPAEPNRQRSIHTTLRHRCCAVHVGHSKLKDKSLRSFELTGTNRLVDCVH
jgi:hypothetical protein